jgi:hypothetical protein
MGGVMKYNFCKNCEHGNSSLEPGVIPCKIHIYCFENTQCDCINYKEKDCKLLDKNTKTDNEVFEKWFNLYFDKMPKSNAKKMMKIAFTLGCKWSDWRRKIK